MQNALLFNEAVSAIDTGNALLLETLLARNPWLLSAFFGTPFGWAIHAEQTTED